MTTISTTTTATDVIWFVPNLIGYTRVAMAILAFILMSMDSKRYWLPSILLYISSFVGDLFDGMAARKWDQCSVMGGLLDMVTDRCATLGFLYILSGDYASVDEQLQFPYYRLVRTVRNKERMERFLVLCVCILLFNLFYSILLHIVKISSFYS